MSRPAATNIKKAPAAIERRASRSRCIRGMYGALDNHEHPVQDDGIPEGRSVPTSVQPPSPALSMP